MKPRSADLPIAARLLAWYEAVARDLPWRRTRDPYAIWVSEAMLQQTQVATVLPFYGRWMAAFPTAEHLAQAEEPEALALWQGLGYYARCRRLHQGVRAAVANGYPQTEKDWLALPGVGAYTAAALASLCNGEPAAVVDGNVARVFARHAGCSATGAALLAQARVWAQAHLDAKRPGDFNQAMMELGATVCRPKNPECGGCPLKEDCAALLGGRTADLPVPAPRLPVHEVHLAVLVPCANDLVGVRPVSHPSWWKGMAEFPTAPTLEVLLELAPAAKPKHLLALRHTVTRHRVSFDVYRVHMPEPGPGLNWHRVEDLPSVPLPAPYRKIAHALAGSRSDT